MDFVIFVPPLRQPRTPTAPTLEPEPRGLPGPVRCMCLLRQVCVYYCSTYYKAVRFGGGDSGGHVLQGTTSRSLCGLVRPSRTSERGGEGYCVKGGGKRKRERAREVRLHYSPGY
jgi:hypothetical protein